MDVTTDTFQCCHVLSTQNIPAAGQTVWCILERSGKIKKQGEVKIHLSFGFEKNSKAALQEHRHLLHVILLHELQISKVNPYICTTVNSYLNFREPNQNLVVFWLVTSYNVERHCKCFQRNELRTPTLVWKISRNISTK
jgi:hypothetical protein